MNTTRTNIINVLDEYLSPKATDYIAPALVMGAGTAGLSILGDESNQEVAVNTIGGMATTALAMYLMKNKMNNKVADILVSNPSDLDTPSLATYDLYRKFINPDTGSFKQGSVIFTDDSGNIIDKLEHYKPELLEETRTAFKNTLQGEGAGLAFVPTMALSYLYEPNGQVVQQVQQPVAVA